MAEGAQSGSVQTTDGYVVVDDSKLRFQFAPLTRRRLANFKANKRGYFSLWIIGSMMVLSFFAELIANDKPLVMGFEGEVYFPVFVVYPETAFGGVFETEAVYRSTAVQNLITAGDGWMLWPPIPFSYDTIDLHTEGAVPEAPSRRHWLGTDDVARDVCESCVEGFVGDNRVAVDDLDEYLVRREVLGEGGQEEARRLLGE